MSNTPPSPFGAPGSSAGSPPPFGAPGARAWETSGSGPTGLQPGSAPPATSKVQKIIAALVVIAIVVVLIVVLAGGDDDSGGASIDGQAAQAGLQSAFDGSSDFADLGFEKLSRCPLGRIGDLVDASGATLSDDAIDADDIAGLVALDDAGLAYCIQSLDELGDPKDGASGISFVASADPPRNVERWVEDFLTTDDSSDAELGKAQNFGGGTIISGCTDISCGAFWSDPDNDLAIGVQLDGEDLKAPAAVNALKKALPVISANLADDAPADTQES